VTSLTAAEEVKMEVTRERKRLWQK